MYAKLRKDLRGQGIKPALFFGSLLKEVDWDNEAFEAEEPTEIENDEFNLVLRGEAFENNLDFACTIDFDFYPTKQDAEES